jgi:hypothetical protein
VNASDVLSDDRVRELARDILGRPEFARFRPSLPGDGWKALLEWLAKALAWLGQLHETSPTLWMMLFVGLLLVALLLLAHVVWSLRAALVANAADAPPRAAREGPRLDREAEQLAAAGRLLDAAHVMHLACIGRLLSSGTLVLRRHDPNRTLRARIAGARLGERDRREFLALLDRLETRWFRDRAPDRGDRELFDAWRALHARLIAESAS